MNCSKQYLPLNGCKYSGLPSGTRTSLCPTLAPVDRVGFSTSRVVGTLWPIMGGMDGTDIRLRHTSCCLYGKIVYWLQLGCSCFYDMLLLRRIKSDTKIEENRRSFNRGTAVFYCFLGSRKRVIRTYTPRRRRPDSWPVRFRYPCPSAAAGTDRRYPGFRCP